MNNRYVFFMVTVLLFTTANFAQAQHKGISFQAVLKDPDGLYPTATGLTLTLQILDPVTNCVLREEEHSGVNISNGYVNLVIGGNSASLPAVKNPNPILSLEQVLNNSQPILGFGCVYNPQAQHPRKLRLIGVIPRVSGGVENVQADFSMRSVAYAIQAENLNGKKGSDFLNINDAKSLNQANAESIFERFTKLDALLNNSNSSGTALGVNISGNAATATNVSGIVAVANGGTGASGAAGARTNLGLGSLATMTPTGTADNSTYLRGDGVWATVVGGGGGAVDSVAGKTGAVTLVGADISDFSTATDARITAQKGVVSGVASLNGSGKVPSSQINLIASDIPNLDASKITSGSIADSLIATMSIDKLVNGAAKYFNYKPNNVACSDNEVLKYDSALNTGAGGWKCASDTGAGAETDPSVAAFAKNAPAAGLVVNGSNQLEVDTGTTLNKIVKLDGSARLPPVDGSLLINLPTGANFTGSLAGDVTGTQGATVVEKIRGFSVTTPIAGDDQKFLKYVHGAGWQAHVVKLSELKNATGLSSAFNVGSCTAAQTLGWSSITDQFACQDINAVPAANVTGLSTVATSGLFSDLLSKPTTLSGFGITDAVVNGGGTVSVTSGLAASRPAFGTAGRIYISTDTKKIERDTGAGWDLLSDGGSASSYTAGAGLDLVGSEFTIETSGVTDAMLANQYASLVGRSGGQSLSGGTAATQNLTLDSTTNVAKGFVLLNPTGGNVGVGTTNPGAKLDVAGQIKITGGAPGVGKILTSDADGLATWEDAAASGGSVTSVDMTVPSYMNVSGAPLTSAGTLDLSFKSQVAKTIFAAPNGADGIPGFRLLGITDIRAVSGGSPAFFNTSGSCAAGSALTYVSATDQVSCQAYSLAANAVATSNITDGSVTSVKMNTTGVISGTYGSASQIPSFTVDAQGRMSAASNIALAVDWSAVASKPTTLAGYGITNAVNKAGDTMTGVLNLPSNGLVVGTSQLVVTGTKVAMGTATASAAKLTVNGSVGTTSNVVASGNTVNLALSNIHHLSSVGTDVIALSNLVNGGTYTLVIADTESRTYNFSGCVKTFFSPASAPTETGKHTIYGLTTITVGGSWHCYVTWASGFSE